MRCRGRLLRSSRCGNNFPSNNYMRWPIPVPIPSSWFQSAGASVGGAGAYIPGGSALSRPSEWISVPKLAALATLAVVWRATRNRNAKAKSETVLECNEKYCPPFFQIHVDTPENTLLKDQSNGTGLSTPKTLPTMATAYERTKRDYYRESVNDPGVRLVAHSID